MSELGIRSGSTRTIGPETKSDPSTFKDDFSGATNVKLLRLAAISGRSLSNLAPLRGGEVAWGNMNLLNVDTEEQITMRPGGVIPEGLWVPVNHLPEEYLKSI